MAAIRIDLSSGDTISLDEGRIKVTLEHKSGSRARLKIQADDSIAIAVNREASDHGSRFAKPIRA